MPEGVFKPKDNPIPSPRDMGLTGAASEGTPKEERQPASDIVHFAGCPLNTIHADTFSLPGEISSIVAGVPSDFPSRKIEACSCDLLSLHLSRIHNATPDEISFMHLTSLLGLNTATVLAAKFHWKYQRPLQVLREVTNARGRNYSARSAKRKRLSSSQAASKKRSSTA